MMATQIGDEMCLPKVIVSLFISDMSYKCFAVKTMKEIRRDNYFAYRTKGYMYLDFL